MKLLKRVLAVLCAIMMVVDLCLASCLTVYAREYYRAEDMIAEDSQPEMAALNVEETVSASEEIATQPAETPAADTEQTEVTTVAETTAVAGETESQAQTTVETQSGEMIESTEIAEEESREPESEETEEFVRTMEYEDGDVKVSVAAVTPNAIPENATLKVVPIVERTPAAGMSAEEIAEINNINNQYKAVEQKLDEKAENEEYDITGFLAYDITFVDKDGNKVEPNGEVKVSMDYKRAVIPAEAAKVDAEATDVTVMHFEEDANGQVKDVVDMVADESKEATVHTTENAEVQKTEFVTDSFSTYTITWTRQNVIITPVIKDGNGKVIVPKTDIKINVNIREGKSGKISDYISEAKAETIIADDETVYEYDHAEVNDETVKYFRYNNKKIQYSNNNRSWETGDLTLYYKKATSQSDKVKVYVYVATKYGDKNQYSWADNEEFLELLGISKDTVDGNGYFPVGEITLDRSYFEGKNSQTVGAALINKEEDWNQLMEALGNLDTSTLSVYPYSRNSGNSVGEHIANAEVSYGESMGSQRTALFRWNMTTSFGFEDQTVKYHLDLKFQIRTIHFIYGNNGIKTEAPDGQEFDTRVYIKGAEIQAPRNLKIPDGYKFAGYFTDEDFTTPWEGIGTPIEEDTTVYVKLAKKEEVVLNYVNVSGSAAGSLSAYNEILKINAEDAQGSTATVNPGYVFDGWYADEECTQLLSGDSVFKPTKPDDGWVDGTTYYARFLKQSTTSSPKVSKSKYIKKNDDGTYDLTLNVSGTSGTITNKALVDIVLVLDNSSSMGGDNSRLGLMKEAVSGMIDSLSGKETVDVMWDVISFSGTSVNQSGGFVDSQSAKNHVNSIQKSSGTNYQAGLTAAESALASSRSGSQKIVVFLTDGRPYGHTGANGEYTGNQQTGFYFGMQAATGINCDKFYAVGVSLGTGYQDYGTYNGEYLGNKTAREVLEDITARVAASEKTVMTTSDEGMTQIFNDISGSVLNVSCKRVEVVDTLSNYVKVNAGTKLAVTIKNSTEQNAQANIVASGETNELTEENLQNGVTFENISLKDNSGTEVTTVTVKYEPTSENGTNGKVTLTFLRDYELESGMVYDITMNISPTDYAVSEYAEKGYVVDGTEITGDLGTDDVNNHTSSGQPGFHSNSSATVTYVYNDSYYEETYDHPVVQVPETKSIEVVKKWADANNAYGKRPSELAFKVMQSTDGQNWTPYKAEGDTTTERDYTEYSMTSDNVDSADLTIWKLTIPDLPMKDAEGNNVIYKVEEISSAANGYVVGYDGASQENVTNTLAWKMVKQSTSVDANGKYVRLEGATFTATKGSDVYYGKSNAQGEIEFYSSDHYGSSISLPDGEYILKETSAPVGYSKDDTEWTLSIIDGVASIKVNGTEKGVYVADENCIVIAFDNEPLYELPEAGGLGIYWYTIGGMLFMMAAALILYKNKHREVLKR